METSPNLSTITEATVTSAMPSLYEGLAALRAAREANYAKLRSGIAQEAEARKANIGAIAEYVEGERMEHQFNIKDMQIEIDKRRIYREYAQAAAELEEREVRLRLERGKLEQMEQKDFLNTTKTF